MWDTKAEDVEWICQSVVYMEVYNSWDVCHLFLFFG